MMVNIEKAERQEMERIIYIKITYQILLIILRVKFYLTENGMEKDMIKMGI